MYNELLIITKNTRLLHIVVRAQRSFARDQRAVDAVVDGHVRFQIQRLLHLTSTQNFIQSNVVVGDRVARRKEE